VLEYNVLATYLTGGVQQVRLGEDTTSETAPMTPR
jgi:hypothetical protein